MHVHLKFPGRLNKFNGDYSFQQGDSWLHLLTSVVGNDYHFLFDIHGLPKPYIAIYLNQEKIDSLVELQCTEGDRLTLISATSGG